MAKTGVIPVIQFLSVLHRVVRPLTIAVMPRFAQNAVCSSKTTSPTARCIACVPSAKRNRGFPTLSASIVAIGLIARLAGIRSLLPAPSLARVVPQPCDSPLSMRAVDNEPEGKNASTSQSRRFIVTII